MDDTSENKDKRYGTAGVRAKENVLRRNGAAACRDRREVGLDDQQSFIEPSGRQKAARCRCRCNET